MKNAIAALLILSSVSAFAESRSGQTSYSNGDGYSSGSSGFSGTSVTTMREQIEANKVSIASFLQSGNSQAESLEVKEIVEAQRALLHAQIDQKSDRDILVDLVSE